MTLLATICHGHKSKAKPEGPTDIATGELVTGLPVAMFEREATSGPVIRTPNNGHIEITLLAAMLVAKLCDLQIASITEFLWFSPAAQATELLWVPQSLLTVCVPLIKRSSNFTVSLCNSI